MLENFLYNLQKKPYETRVRILWTATAIIAILLIIIWIVSIKVTISNSSKPADTPVKTVSSVEFVNVERIEKAGSLMKIYFNLNNNTTDILNVSAAEDITLQTSAGSLHPSSILDRQGQPFAQKVLSKTQVFGILTFAATADKSAELTFDNMALEQNLSQPLKQVLKLDITKLNQPANVRN